MSGTFNRLIAEDSLVVKGRKKKDPRKSPSGNITITGPRSDYLMDVQDGNGRIQHKWNATKGRNEKYLISREPAFFWDITVIGSTYIEYKYAPPGIAGELIPWQTHMAFNSDGKIGIGTTRPETQLHVNGSIYANESVIDNIKIVDQTSGNNYNMISDDRVILLKIGVNSTNLTINLLSTIGRKGRRVEFKIINDEENGGKVSLNPSGNEKIDNQDNYLFGLIQGSLGCISIISDGNNWWILNVV